MLPYIKLFPDLLATVDAMDDAMAGRLLKAMLNYANDREPELSGPERFVWLMLKSQLDRDAAAYEEMRAVNSINGAKGGRPKKAVGFSEKRGVSEKTEKSQEEEKEKEKEEDKDKEKEGGVKEAPALPPVMGEADKLCSYIADNLTPMNADIMDEMLSYREHFGDDVIRDAVNETLKNGSRASKYCLAILRRELKEGYKDLTSIKAAREKRQALKTESGKGMITRQISENEDFYTDIMNRPRRTQ